MANFPKFSFIIPIKDEKKSIQQLIGEIKSNNQILKDSYEIIFIDDGSVDDSFALIKTFSRKDRRIRAFKLRGNFGKSIALSVGFLKCHGQIIFTLDGDLQDDPKEISNFIKKLNEGYDMVSGWKKRRFDPISKTLPSKLGNSLARILTGVNIHDFNSGYKVYKREVIENLHLYGELYKFIPILAYKQNFRVGEIVVEHRKRKFGESKFGWDRNIKGLLDLITIVFLAGYLKKPGHFFGTIGVLFFIPGFIIGLYITYLRITTGTIDFRYPLLFLGALLMIVGVQFISTGLLAEMIISTRENIDYSKYITEKTN